MGLPPVDVKGRLRRAFPMRELVSRRGPLTIRRCPGILRSRLWAQESHSQLIEGIHSQLICRATPRVILILACSFQNDWWLSQIRCEPIVIIHSTHFILQLSMLLPHSLLLKPRPTSKELTLIISYFRTFVFYFLWLLLFSSAFIIPSYFYFIYL